MWTTTAWPLQVSVSSLHTDTVQVLTLLPCTSWFYVVVCFFQVCGTRQHLQGQRRARFEVGVLLLCSVCTGTFLKKLSLLYKFITLVQFVLNKMLFICFLLAEHLELKTCFSEEPHWRIHNIFMVFWLTSICIRVLIIRVKILKMFMFVFSSSAVAVYTGMETKMALNYQSKSQKRSAVEKYD